MSQSDTSTPLAFMMPVVHPGGRRVSNYAVVEKSLRLTLTSLTAKGHGSAPVFVVCHKVPDWHADFAPTVKFLVIPEHPWFPDDVKDRFSAEKGDRRGVRVDMGLKYLAGMLYARQAHDPTFLMPMDADDFVRSDLVQNVQDAARGRPDTDCFLITHGFHLPLQNTADGFLLKAAFQLDRFDETCGTSRVFDSNNFFKIVEKHGPELLEFGAHDIIDQENCFNPAFLDALGRLAERDIDKEPSFVRIMGSHTTQDAFFRLTPIEIPLAGKACGHGNHVGWQHGGIHWHKFYKVASSRKFADDFGIGNTALLQRSLDLKTKLKGWRCVLHNKKNPKPDLA